MCNSQLIAKIKLKQRRLKKIGHSVTGQNKSGIIFYTKSIKVFH